MNWKPAILRRVLRFAQIGFRVVEISSLVMLMFLWIWTFHRVVNFKFETADYDGTNGGHGYYLLFRDGRISIHMVATDTDGTFDKANDNRLHPSFFYLPKAAPYRMSVRPFFQKPRLLYDIDGYGFGTGVIGNFEDGGRPYTITGWALIIPAYLPVILLLIMLSPLIIRSWRSRKKPANQCCPACSYDLRGNPGSARCPECGNLIPLDLQTNLAGLSTPTT